jgi:hypothetical protein
LLRNVAYGLLRKNPTERLSTTQLVSDPFLRPKVTNFPQQYRPKYLEERIRRSHTKQLEQQIELITRLERRTSNAFQQGLSRESSFSSRNGGGLGGASSFIGFNSPLMNGHGGNNDSFVLQSSKTVDSSSSGGGGSDSSPSNSIKASAASQQIVEHIQSLDILPTLLESLGSYSSSEKVTINHKSFIIDDENIINSLNAQQQQTLLEEGFDEDDGEGGIRLLPSPIRQAKADINIVDGVFGNEKFITIDVKITPKTDDDDGDSYNDGRAGSAKGGNEGNGGGSSSLLRRSLLTTTGGGEEGGTTVHGHVGHKSKRNSVPVLELHYTTEIKLTNPGESNEFLANPHHHFTIGAAAGGHHHHHHHDLLTRRSLTGNGSKKYLQTVDDSSTAKIEITEGDMIDNKTRTNSLDAVNSRTSLSEAVDSPGTPVRKQMAIVRQQSTSMINGKVLNNSVEEILTSLNAVNIEELQLSQFHRLTDTIENVFHPHVVEEHHRRQSLLSTRSNSNPLLPIAEVAFGIDGSGGDESFEGNDNDRLIVSSLTTSNKENNNADNVVEKVREKAETELSHVTIATTVESSSERTDMNSSPSHSPFSGGSNNRVRKSITEAIAQDHEFNSPSAVVDLNDT